MWFRVCSWIVSVVSGGQERSTKSHEITLTRLTWIPGVSSVAFVWSQSHEASASTWIFCVVSCVFVDRFCRFWRSRAIHEITRNYTNRLTWILASLQSHLCGLSRTELRLPLGFLCVVSCVFVDRFCRFRQSRAIHEIKSLRCFTFDDEETGLAAARCDVNYRRI